MSMKQLLAGLAGSAVMFALGWLWFNVIAVGYQVAGDAAIIRPDSLWMYTLMGYLVLGLSMAWIYPRGYEGGPPLHEGLRYGVAMGVAVRVSSLLLAYSFWNIQLPGTLVFAVYSIVELTVGAVVIAMVYGSGGEETEES